MTFWKHSREIRLKSTIFINDMKKELRELKVNVTNPNYDRRRKYGEDATEKYKAGIRFLLRYHGPNEHFPALEGLPDTVLFKKTSISDPTLVKLLYASSAVVPPATFADVLLIHGISADPTLEQLLSDGVVTIAQVEEAQLKVSKRYDEEEARREKEEEEKRAARLAAKQEQQPATT